MLIKKLLNRLTKTAIFTNLNIRFVYSALQIRIDDELLQARKNEPERGFLCKKAETRGASRLR